MKILSLLLLILLFTLHPSGVSAQAVTLVTTVTNQPTAGLTNSIATSSTSLIFFTWQTSPGLATDVQIGANVNQSATNAYLWWITNAPPSGWSARTMISTNTYTLTVPGPITNTCSAGVQTNYFATNATPGGNILHGSVQFNDGTLQTTSAGVSGALTNGQTGVVTLGGSISMPGGIMITNPVGGINASGLIADTNGNVSLSLYNTTDPTIIFTPRYIVYGATNKPNITGAQLTAYETNVEAVTFTSDGLAMYRMLASVGQNITSSLFTSGHQIFPISGGSTNFPQGLQSDSAYVTNSATVAGPASIGGGVIAGQSLVTLGPLVSQGGALIPTTLSAGTLAAANLSTPYLSGFVSGFAGPLAQTNYFDPATNGYGTSYRILTARFSGTPFRDLITLSSESNSISLLTNDGHGVFTRSDGQFPINGTAAADLVFGGAVGDFNGDGSPDIAVGDYTTGFITVLTNDSHGKFSLAQSFSASGGIIGVAAGPVASIGGLPDIVAVNGGNLVIFTNTGTGAQFVQAQSIGGGNTPFSVTLGDWNGDGWLDAAVCNLNSADVTVFTNTGSGAIMAVSQTISSGGSDPTGISTADFNNDLFPDLIIANNSGVAVVLTNNGASFGGGGYNLGPGTFTLAATVTTASGCRNAAAGDFNGDGWMDIITANAAGGTLTIITNSPSGFGVWTNITTGGVPYTAVTGDWDGDGTTDFAAALEDSNTIVWSLNRCTSSIRLSPVGGADNIAYTGLTNLPFATLDAVTNFPFTGTDGNLWYIQAVRGH